MASSEKSTSKGQAWFCTTGLPSDIEIEVDDMTFHLHKFPLMSKSRKLHRLITEQETRSFSSINPQTSMALAVVVAESDEKGKGHEIEDEEEEQQQQEQEIEENVFPHITLEDFPGSSESFEMVAKFCYGVKIDLSASSAVPLRCAAEHLEMTEEYSPDNLISKTERFLSNSVYKSLRESIKALQACEPVSPLAESLGLTEQCVESIVSRASSADPSLFGWPVNDGGGVVNDLSLIPGGCASKSAADARRKKQNRDTNTELWFEDLAQLSLPIFRTVILSMRSEDLSSDVIESCLICYAKKHIPGILRSNRKPSSSSTTTTSAASENEQREILETITSNLPLDKSSSISSTTTTTRFLFGLLRTAIILDASETCRDLLERKIGSQLERATLDDLLVPSYSYLNETLYDVDLVERILSHFLDSLEEQQQSNTTTALVVEADGRSPSLMLVGKLIDGFLAEIASDANLKSGKFYNLAISLPDQARLYDDGLYRAVDVYLKAHPWVTEEEKEKICGVMDCQKLTLEACTHAAQNERLPLRTVVQVLFFEQLQLRHAIAGTLLAAQSPSPSHSPRPSATAARRNLTIAEVVNGNETRVEEEGEVDGVKWKKTVRENQVLRLDMDTMRTRVHRLERECSNMKKVIAKIDKLGSPATTTATDRPRSWSITKKFGCKFKTQVCDSQEATVVDHRSRRV